MVKLDFSNAFNSLRRDSAADAIARHLPQLCPFFNAAYAESSILLFGDTTLSSAEGLQQGDPLAHVFFCVAIHDLIADLTHALNCVTWMISRL